METREVLSIAGTEDGVRRAADALEAFGVGHGVAPDVRWRFLVALDEALSNIVRYGYRDRAGEIELTFSVAGESLTVALSDSAPMFNPLLASAAPTAAAPPPDSGYAGGAGIALALTLMDEVHYERREDRNHLLFRGRVRPSQS
jgi:sigma-B regulation protein RsbU (phosphoserine phosphatase)